MSLNGHTNTVGILSPKDAFSAALLAMLTDRKIEAEWCRVRELDFQQPSRYRIILDRISHCYEYYLPFLKHAAVNGCYVINNPFRFLADDKFFNYSLATRLGVPIPKTIALPCKEYDNRVLKPDDLHNLQFPIDWDHVVEHIGFPAILKPYDGYGWREVHKVENLQQLRDLYNESMMDVMMLQEFIDFEHYVRCFVVGQKWVLPVHYLPLERRYIVDHQHLSDAMGQKIVEDCQTINRALGYDINTVEFAIRDGVAYAIDFMNPVPDAKPEVISYPYFHWFVSKVCDLIEEVLAGSRATPYHLSEQSGPIGQHGLEVELDRAPRKRFAAWS
jgi:hypothetical protein